MIIPHYWAEARLQHRERRRQITVRRFGWSDTSDADAQAHADARVREALDRLIAGERLLRFERRVAYNGAEGVPIREEIVDRDGDAVVTRNCYGALCLNTPNVLFADIDFGQSSTRKVIMFSMMLAATTILGVMLGLLKMPLLGSVIVSLIGGRILGLALVLLIEAIWVALRGGRERIALQRVASFVKEQPQWRLRVYRTPAGLRLIAMHRRFDPREPEVAACFDALGVDRTYAKMCRNQNCFRARLSPKPWRIGLPRLRAPYSAAWRPEHAQLPARLAWIAEYERESKTYAACRFVETLGGGKTDPDIKTLCELHDTMCQAESDFPIA